MILKNSTVHTAQLVHIQYNKTYC